MAEPLRVPGSAGELFRVFNRMALQGFGGVIVIAQRELVERERWMTREQFLETLSVAQVLPGPNIVNAAIMIGDRFHGARGVVAAMSGLLVLPLAIVITLAALYGEFAHNPVVAGALRGMGAVAAGLILSTALKLALALRKSPLGPALCLGFVGATLVCVGLLRWPLAAVVLGLGTVSTACAWVRMKRA